MPKEAEPLMTPQEMKPLLMLSKRQPVNAAIALDKEKNAVILLDKKAKPRKMAALMKKQAKDAKLELNMSTLRFGTAEVDTDVDSKLVKFVVNKEAAGVMELKLLVLLKKSGFGKCSIVVDDKLEQEPEEDDEAAAPADAPAAKAAPQAEAAQPGQQPQGQQQDDMGPLAAQLTALVKKMMGVMGSNPPGADAMKTAAMEGNAAVKAKDAQGAQNAIDTLGRLLDATAGAAAAGGAKGHAKNAPGSPVFKTAQATWVAARKIVENQIGTLSKELQNTYKDHPIGGDITSVFEKKVEPILDNLDHSLSEKLAQVQGESDPAAHGKLVDEAKAIIGKYQSYLQSEKLIEQLDKNPFVPLKIEETLVKSLTQLAKSVS